MTTPFVVSGTVDCSGAAASKLDQLFAALEEDRPATLEKTGDVISFRAGFSPVKRRRFLRSFLRGRLAAVDGELSYELDFTELIIFASLWSLAFAGLLMVAYDGRPFWPLVLTGGFWFAIAFGGSAVTWLQFRRIARDIVARKGSTPGGDGS